MNGYLSIIVAIITAILSGIITHNLTKRRENGKKDKEIYNEFVAPFITEVLIYYSAETNFRKAHDVEKEVDPYKLMKRIRKHIKFGNINLMSKLIEYEKTEYFFDGRGGLREIKMLIFFYYYLEYCLYIVRKFTGKDKILLNEIERTQKKYGIWIILVNIFGYDEATKIMGYDFEFPEAYFDVITTEQIEMIIKKSEDGRTSSEEYAFLEGMINVLKNFDKGLSSGIVDDLERGLNYLRN